MSRFYNTAKNAVANHLKKKRAERRINQMFDQHSTYNRRKTDRKK